MRHQGFIPWDDDLDVVMLRPDYERARDVMKAELNVPFEWQDLYMNMTVCSSQEIMLNHMLPFAKIRNKDTTAIELPVMPRDINQGIWIDVFPLDDARDDIKFTEDMFRIEKELYCATFGTPEIKQYMVSAEYDSAIPKSDLIGILNLPVSDRFAMFENIINSFVGTSTKYTYKFGEILERYEKGPFDKTLFSDVIMMPFEGFDFPVPVGYETILTQMYGEYNIPVIDQVHSAVFDEDISYLDYLDNPDKYMGRIELGVD